MPLYFLSHASAEPAEPAAEPTEQPKRSRVSTPAQAEAAASGLAPRLFAQAGETDEVGSFPTKEFGQ